MTSQTASFTELLRHPNDVTRRVAGGDVVIRRRDDEDLILTTVSREQARLASVEAVSHLFADALEDDVVRQHIARRAALPWTRFLPPEDRELFYRELFECVAGAVEIGTMAPVAQLLSEWQATAAVHADPELAARMRRADLAEGAPISRPSGA